MKALTFRELLMMLPKTEGKKLPSIKELKSRDQSRIFIDEKSDDIQISIYDDGFLLYRRDKQYTAFAVDRCIGIPSFVADDTMNERKGGMTNTRKVMMREEEYYDLRDGWKWPIIIMCERRLDHNMEMREEQHKAYSLDNLGNDWFGDPETDEEQTPFLTRKWEELCAIEREREFMEETIPRLKQNMKKLSKRQRKALMLYISFPKITEREMAAVMTRREGKHISHQGVHKLLSKGINNLKKMEEKGCQTY